jgi:hypothetical protein
MRSTNDEICLLGAFAYMRRAKRIDSPATIFLMGNQGTNADDRVIHVLRELVAHRSANFVVALAVMIIGGCKALDIGDRFDVPSDDTTHDSNVGPNCLDMQLSIHAIRMTNSQASI